MEDRQKSRNDRVDNEILFSKTVKAGKRVYYIDVKRDRKGEFYISMTESKRLKEIGADPMRPTFEKHKIFIYREDLNKFQAAFNEVANYTNSSASSQPAFDWNDSEEETENGVDEEKEPNNSVDYE